jgi:hypothetical protein
MATTYPADPAEFDFDPIVYVLDVLNGVVVDPWSHLRIVDDPTDAWTGTCEVCGEYERACLMSQCGALGGEPIRHDFQGRERK